jgi:hypothetical protein
MRVVVNTAGANILFTNPKQMRRTGWHSKAAMQIKSVEEVIDTHRRPCSSAAVRQPAPDSIRRRLVVTVVHGRGSSVSISARDLRQSTAAMSRTEPSGMGMLGVWHGVSRTE